MQSRLFPLQAFRPLCLAAALALGVAGLANGCRRSEPSAPQAPAVQRYPLRGEILAVNAEERILMVRHEEIPGYMPAMTMEFSVNAGDAKLAQVGQRIRAELVEEAGEYRLEKIWVEDIAKDGRLQVAAQALLQDTVSKGRGAYREIGETIPDFTLLDQTGAVVEAGRFRGKRVLLNFIFTRCPVATMCPAAVAKFQQIQREAKEAGITDLELVSISLDPTYDTPGVLQEYVVQRGIDTSNYTFLTGPEMAVKSLLTQFGILTELKGDLLNHTLATILIGPDGRVLHRADGSAWNTADFLRRLKTR